jgi:hypothetical protein
MKVTTQALRTALINDANRWATDYTPYANPETVAIFGQPARRWRRKYDLADINREIELSIGSAIDNLAIGLCDGCGKVGLTIELFDGPCHVMSLCSDCGQDTTINLALATGHKDAEDCRREYRNALDERYW